MYQLPADTFMGTASCIKRLSDNAFIPFDLANTDYQAYLKWLEEGNAPIEAYQPVQPTEENSNAA